MSRRAVSLAGYSQQEMQAVEDLQSAALLCEAAYRTHFSAGELRGHLDGVRALLSEADVGDLEVHTAGDQRYVVSHGPSAVYVAFQGTKHLGDWAANLRFKHAPLWRGGGAGDVGSNGGEALPAAHGGFSERSMGLPLEELRSAARAAGKRLVLCGHSLGGAVAMLGTVSLLRDAAPALGGADASLRAGKERAAGSGGGGGDPQIRCISFAAPPVANGALAAEVAASGWDRYISNFVLPEDPVAPVVNKLLRAVEAEARDRPLLEAILAQAAAAAGVAVPELGRGAGGAGLSAARPPAPAPAPVRWPAAAGDAAGAVAAAVAAVAGRLRLPVQPLALDGAAGGAAAAARGPRRAAPLGPSPAAAMHVQSAARRGAGRALGWWAQPQQRREPPGAPPAGAARPRLAGGPRPRWALQAAPGRGPWAREQQAQGLALDARWAGFVLLPGIHHALRLPPAAAALVAAAGARAGAPAAALRAGGPAAAARAARAWARRALVGAAGGALLRGGLRAAAAALAAPRLAARAAAPALGRLLPAAFGAELVGSAIVAAVVPRTHAIGAQWVLSHEGLARADRPIAAYPRAPQSLGLQELGGLFPGHRMVAYRNRVAHLAAARRGDGSGGAAGAAAAPRGGA